MRAGAERAELAAGFDVDRLPDRARVARGEGAGGDGDEVLLRRVLDAQGRSRAWINGSAATLAQLKSLGEMLVAIHGQHAHQSLEQPEAQRAVVDAFGGFTTLAREVARELARVARGRGAPDAAASAAEATASEREFLEQRQARACGARRDRRPSGANCRPRNRASRTRRS